MLHYYLSSKRSTFMVSIGNNGIIKNAAPIAKRYLGKRLKQLIYDFRIDKVKLLGGSNEE